MQTQTFCKMDRQHWSKTKGMTDYEKYLAGMPLNKELEELRDGKTHQTVAPQQPAQQRLLSDIDRPLTAQELEDLKEIRALPGWGVLLRLKEKLAAIHEKSAISISRHDPLANRDSVANEWAYVNMIIRGTAELFALAEAEIKTLEARE